MCTIAVGPAASIIPHVRDAMDANPHGAGVAWYDGRELVYLKGLTSARQVRKILHSIGTGSAVFHARIATSGGQSPILTHPFEVERYSPLAYHGRTDMLLFHNGISRLDWQALVPKGRLALQWSDTRALAHGLAVGAVTRENLAADGGRFVIFEKWRSGAGFEYLGPEWTDLDGARWSNLFWRWRSLKEWRGANWTDWDWSHPGFE